MKHFKLKEMLALVAVLPIFPDMYFFSSFNVL